MSGIVGTLERGRKKGSETVSETHLLLAGQRACENQAAFLQAALGEITPCLAKSVQ